MGGRERERENLLCSIHVLKIILESLNVRFSHRYVSNIYYLPNTTVDTKDKRQQKKSIQAKKQMDSKVQYRGLKSGKNKSDLVAILGQLLKEVLLN